MNHHDIEPLDGRCTGSKETLSKETLPQETLSKATASPDAALERELDELASHVSSDAAEAHADTAYDDRDYHALAQGFHAAQKSYLEAERRPAVLHRFPERDGANGAGIPRPARYAAWIAYAAIAAGLALIAWTAFGGSSAETGGAEEITAPGNLRGNGDAIELRLEREGTALRFAWSTTARAADAPHTLRIYPQGSLRALVVRPHLSGGSALFDPSELEIGTTYEAEVELETETGIAPASPRLAFTR